MKEKLKKMTIAELQKRQGELQAIGQNPENRTSEELEQLAEERQAIDEELNERRNQANLEVLRRAAMANGTVPATVLQSRQIEAQGAQQRTFAVDSVEYRNAYLKNLMGKPLDAEERAALTSANAVIPTEMQNKIWDKLRENPLIAEIDMLHVPGYVVLPKATTVNDANWVAIGTAATDSADVVGSVSLGAKKLIKTIEIEADIKAMSIPAFQTWLVNKLVEKWKRRSARRSSTARVPPLCRRALWLTLPVRPPRPWPSPLRAWAKLWALCLPRIIGTRCGS